MDGKEPDHGALGIDTVPSSRLIIERPFAF
jgi:hypothetical protein